VPCKIFTQKKSPAKNSKTPVFHNSSNLERKKQNRKHKEKMRAISDVKREK